MSMKKIRRRNKSYYRRLIADKRRSGRPVCAPKASKPRFARFTGLDEAFCARTILSRIASLYENVPLSEKAVIALPRVYLDDFGPAAEDGVLVQFAEAVERFLSRLLSRSVCDFNQGHSAGYHSRSYDLGTKETPIKVDDRNAIYAGLTLATCGMKIPSARYDHSIMLVPPFMACMMRAQNPKLAIRDPFPILPKNIRSGVDEVGTLAGNLVFTDEAITGESSAYAIRPDAIRWNFEFLLSDDASCGFVWIMLRFGFCIAYPEYITKMEVSKGHEHHHTPFRQSRRELGNQTTKEKPQ